MLDLFRLVVRWIAAILVAVPAGSLATAAGSGQLAAAIGALMLLLGGTFVAGSVLATYFAFATRIGREATATEGGALGELAGPGLLRATFLGFVGAGLTVGALVPLGFLAVISAASGALALVLTIPLPLRRPR